jgi:hypothetical protein
MIIQQVYLNDGENLYILGYNPEKSELTFRTSRVPEYKQTEKILQVGYMIKINLYEIPIQYLQKFIDENN